MKHFMLFVILIGFALESCKPRQNEAEQAPLSSEFMIERPQNVPKGAKIINLGFSDKPVYQWIFYTGILELDGKNYPHIHEFTYWDFDGNSPYRQYYEYAKSRNESHGKKFNGYDIVLNRGDATILLRNKQNFKDSCLLFVVLETKEFEREFRGKMFRRISAARKNKNDILVSDGELEVSFVSTARKDSLIATFISDGKIFDASYLNPDLCDISNGQVSYLNKTNGYIYLVPVNCCLVPVNHINPFDK